MDHKFLKPRQLELDPNASDAEKHWKHWNVRDSFIRGLKSSDIRQRLLEECINRNTTLTKARTLELSVKNSQLIGSNSIINAISIENDTDNVTAQEGQTTTVKMITDPETTTVKMTTEQTPDTIIQLKLNLQQQLAIILITKMYTNPILLLLFLPLCRILS